MSMSPFGHDTVCGARVPDYLGVPASEHLGELLTQHPFLCGAFLAGSRLDRGRGPETDIDLRGVVLLAERPPGTVEKRSRYGVRLRVPGFPEVLELPTGKSKCIAEWIILPYEELLDVDRLVRTHWLFAASTALRHEVIVHDRTGELAGTSARISANFCRSEHVLARLRYVLHLCIQKLEEYQLEPKTGAFSPRAFWDGPVWGLLSLGTMVLTVRGDAPTFRRHLLRVRDGCRAFGLVGLYQDLLDLWGVRQLTNEQVRGIANVAMAVYRRCAAATATPSLTVHPLKTHYYCDMLAHLVESADWQESVCLSAFLMLQAASRWTELDVSEQSAVMSCVDQLGLARADLPDRIARLARVFETELARLCVFDHQPRRAARVWGCHRSE